jgi:hypothetical protein
VSSPRAAQPPCLCRACFSARTHGTDRRAGDSKRTHTPVQALLSRNLSQPRALVFALPRLSLLHAPSLRLAHLFHARSRSYLSRALALISSERALSHLFHALSPSSLPRTLSLISPTRSLQVSRSSFPRALSLFHRSTRLPTALGSSSELLLFPLDCFDPSMLSDRCRRSVDCRGCAFVGSRHVGSTPRSLWW